MFVLDGQQRLTSLFSVLFSNCETGKVTRNPNMMVALSSDPEWVEQPFHLHTRNIVRQERDGLLIPADTLFESVRGKEESLAISKAIAEWVKVEDPKFFPALDRANRIRTAILQAEIVAYEIDADADDDSVIEIFARLNQQGVRLKPGDLAAARLTGHMKGFRSMARSVLGQPSLKSFASVEGEDDAPRSGAFVDTDLLVRTAMFLSNNVVKYREIEERSDISKAQAYNNVQSKWDAAAAGLTYSVSIFKNAGVPDGSWIQYRYVLLPPAIWHASLHVPKDDFWLAWAVLACLWGQYSGSAETHVQADAIQARDGSIQGILDNLKNHAKRPESVIPEAEDFKQQIVQERGVVLGLLLNLKRRDARTFPSGKRISKLEEPLEVHHIFPKAFLNQHLSETRTFQTDRLGNLTILSRSDNENISDDPPSVALAHVTDADLTDHCIPVDRDLWSIENYEAFCEARETTLAESIRNLLATLAPEIT